MEWYGVVWCVRVLGAQLRKWRSVCVCAVRHGVLMALKYAAHKCVAIGRCFHILYTPENANARCTRADRFIARPIALRSAFAVAAARVSDIRERESGADGRLHD